MSKKVRTLYLTSSSYQRLKDLVSPKPVSQEIDGLIGKRVSVLEGGEYDPAERVDIQALHVEHQRVIRDLDRLQNKLLKKGVYKDLAQLAFKVGLDKKDYANAAEISSEFLNQWTGPKEYALEFVNVMETAKRKHEVEKLLSDAIAARNRGR